MKSETITEESTSQFEYVRYYFVESGLGTGVVDTEDQILPVRIEDADAEVVDINGMSVLPPVLTRKSTVTRSRERTPYDEPPGVGYNALVQNRKFVRNKTYLHRTYELIDYDIIRPKFYSDGSVAGVYPIRVREKQGFLEILGYDQTFGTEANRAALINLYGSIQRRQDMKLGVFIAELKDSLSLLGKSMLIIAKVVRALKRGRISSAVSALADHVGGSLSTRNGLLDRVHENRRRRRRGQAPLNSTDYAAKGWLELQFGWLPVLSDIYSIVNVIGGSLNHSDPDGILVFHGYGQASGPYTKDLAFDYVSSISYAYWREDAQNGYFSGTVEERCSYTAIYKVSNDIVDVLAQLGLTNPLSIAWEIVPFSFVIDWFLPIGRFIDSLQADAGLELIQLSVSTKRSVEGELGGQTRKRYASYDTGSQVWHDEWIDFRLGYTAQDFQRIADIDVDGELPSPPLPRWTFDELLSPWKAVTALALLNVTSR